MLRQSFTGLKMEKVRVSADRARAASSGADARMVATCI
jgi:hypothetical protein